MIVTERSHSQSQTQMPTHSRPLLRRLTEAEEYARSVQLREELSSAVGSEVGHRRPRPVSGINPDVLESRRISMGDMPQLRRQASGTLTPVATSTSHQFSKMVPGSGPDTRRASQFRPAQFRTPPSPDNGSYTHQSHMNANFTSYPPELPGFLDGTHHTDELATRFEVGWPILEKWLVTLGEGQGNGDFGRVAIMYR